MTAPAAPTLRIFLIDDHRLFRDGLRLILEKETDLHVVGEAHDAASAIHEAATGRPDIILADVHLPETDGIELAARLMIQNHPVRVVFLSSDANPTVVRRALDAGASGYILKDSAPNELIHALKAIVGGGIYLSADLSSSLFALPREAPQEFSDPPENPLSTREMEILRHISEGLRNKEIADRLGIGIKSVETYRSRLLKKLGYDSTAELVRYAIRTGIITA
jgi:two-component system, NarL family, response regulator NreC